MLGGFEYNALHLIEFVKLEVKRMQDQRNDIRSHDASQVEHPSISLMLRAA